MITLNEQRRMEYEELLMIIKDGIKFVQNFAGLIDKSTPHLYLSALPFSPSKSILARSLTAKFARIAKVAVGQQSDWPRNLHVLHGHTDSVLSVAFSPLDGRHIASGSRDNMILLWDTQTDDQVLHQQNSLFWPQVPQFKPMCAILYSLYRLIKSTHLCRFSTAHVCNSVQSVQTHLVYMSL